jgi:hypothetical protein
MLRRALRYAPVQVCMTGVSLNDPRFDQPGIPQWIWLATELNADTFPVLSTCPLSQVVRPAPQRDWEAEPVAWASLQELARIEVAPTLPSLPCLGWQTLVDVPGRHTLAVVHHGVVLPWGGTEEKGEPAGSHTLISSPELTLDAAGSRPVFNHALESCIKASRRNFKRLFRVYRRAHGDIKLSRLVKGY